VAQAQEEDAGTALTGPVPEQYWLAAVTAIVAIGSIVAVVLSVRL
jgi:hypothetical protein